MSKISPHSASTPKRSGEVPGGQGTLPAQRETSQLSLAMAASLRLGK